MAHAWSLTALKVVSLWCAEPIDLGYRWLNRLAIADLDGDGRKEAAYIETPHIGGILTIVRPTGERLEVVATRADYSTPAMGSHALDLASVADLNGNGAAEIVLPDQSRTHLVIVQLKGTRLIERWRSDRFLRVEGGLRLESIASGWHAVYLSGGG